MTGHKFAADSSSTGKPGPILTVESFYVGLLFAAGCWLLDALLAASVIGISFQSALIPDGEALVLRFAVTIAVAIAAAVTSAYLVRELRYRDAAEDIYNLPQSDLVASFSDCAFAVNASGEIIDANDAAARLFSWPVNMFMPMKIDWLVSEFISDSAKKVTAFSDLSAGIEKSPVTLSVIGKALSGRKFVAEMTCLPVVGDDERLIVLFRKREAEDAATHDTPSDQR